MNGLIGYTGFVGSTLQRQATFEQTVQFQKHQRHRRARV